MIFITLGTIWADETKGPSLIILEPHYDAKEVQEGTIINHSFNIKNEGDALLEIQKVKPDWGCAVASFDRSIPPGGEGKITLRLDTKEKHGDVIKKARVFSNDSNKSIQIVSIKTWVKTSIIVSPGSVYFNGKIGQDLKKIIQISAKEKKHLRLKPDQFDLEKIMSFEIKEIEAGKEYQLIFLVNPTSPGLFRGALKLRTNYPEKPEITIPIRGAITKELQTLQPKQAR